MDRPTPICVHGWVRTAAAKEIALGGTAKWVERTEGEAYFGSWPWPGVGGRQGLGRIFGRIFNFSGSQAYGKAFLSGNCAKMGKNF